MPEAPHTSFTGSIPAFYDRYLGPVLFEPFARDLARRLPMHDGARVLETAAGTGLATRRVLERLPANATLVATDLNPAMLEHARASLPADPRLELRTADAQALPFPDAAFDVVVNQFGTMFVPDKPRALREAHRVLVPGGRLLYTTWGPFANNAFGRIVDGLLQELFPEDPPTFYRTPFSDHDPAELASRTLSAGFRDVTVESIAFESTSESAEQFAIGLVRGNPVAITISERGTLSHEQVESKLADALRRELGDRPMRAYLQSWLVTASA
jgi:ubiquinone/menaquinone biosynthesis C-methylase UbiE